ncbi:DUF4198 domain-containing protein [Planctomycetes bacterium Pan216]
MVTTGLRVTLVLGMMVATGCGGGEDNTARVAGIVTLDGQPLPDARLSFEPIATGSNPHPGRGSYGRTDMEGRFTLKVVGGSNGAVIGKHRVRISTYRSEETEMGMNVLAEEKVPPRYNAETQLVFEVPADGTSDANFELVSK